MNIIITGACGHIGTFLAEKIRDVRNIKNIYLIDNISSKNYNFFFKKKKIKKFKFHFIDITKKNSLDIFKNIDVLIHCASMTNAAQSFNVKNEMFKNNIGCFKTVIDYCIKKKVKLIHLSSTSVYGKQTKIVDENCEKKFLKPQSPYAKIKILEEEMLMKVSKKMKYITLRLGTISGVSDGIRFHTAVNKFCLNSALSIPVSVYKTALHQYRPYLSLSDAFKAIKFIIDRNFFRNEIFNIVTNNYTVNQILEIIKIYKKNIKIKFVSSKIMNQLSYHVSKKKITRHGLKLSTSIQGEIKATLKMLENIN
jgi:UDP-glucose 4-epimerase